jgi:glucose/arabinose dehydrogenase
MTSRSSRGRAALAATIALLSLCTWEAPYVGALPRRARVQTYKSGLDFPVDMAWVRHTRRMFFTEKNSGKVRVLVGGRLLKRACANLDVDSSGERGALGIALHPRFARNHLLYVYYTNASPVENRVARFVVRHNRCRHRHTLVSGIAASSSGYHNGGQLELFRGHLFVSTGDAHDPALATSPDNRLGKVLRYNPDGSVPRGNPFSSSGQRNPVWSYGHRNPFGLAHEPGTGRLYETENGPDCDDEVNRIRPGRNYGWGPGYQCDTAGVGARPKRPLWRWSSVVAPTDPWWYRGRMGALSGSLYVGDFLTGRLHRFVLNRTGTRVRRHRPIYDSGAAILDVSKGPGGWLYYATPGAILRIVPRRR